MSGQRGWRDPDWFTEGINRSQYSGDAPAPLVAPLDTVVLVTTLSNAPVLRIAFHVVISPIHQL